MLEKQRKPIEVGTGSLPWNSYNTDDVIIKSEMEDSHGDEAILPPHRVVKIYTEDEIYAREMRSHCDQLELLTKR